MYRSFALSPHSLDLSKVFSSKTNIGVAAKEVFMRRATILALAVGLAFSVAACGKKGPLDKPQREKQDEKKTALILPR